MHARGAGLRSGWETRVFGDGKGTLVVGLVLEYRILETTVL